MNRLLESYPIDTPSTSSSQQEEVPSRLMLSLDGGGIRGLLEAYVLDYLEQTIESEINKHFNDPKAPAPEVRLGECFDMVAGTSAGGILTLALRMVDPTTNRPKLRMKEMLGLYENKGELIFPNTSLLAGWLSAKYKPQPLEKLLKEYFGETTLKDLKQPALVTTYDIDQEGLYLFKSDQARHTDSQNFQLKDVARATAAAPTYIPAAEVHNSMGDKFHFVDGGVAANNPVLLGYEEAHRVYPRSNWDVISIGTGTTRLFTLGGKKSGGKLSWASDITHVTMNSSSKIADVLAEQSIKRQGGDYVRLQFDLDQKAGDMDNASTENINRLKGYLKSKIEDSDPTLMKIKDKLVNFYAERNYYIFHSLIQKADKQLQSGDGEVSLSDAYLSERAVWELMHALSSNNFPAVNSLDISHNPISAHNVSLLGRLTHLKRLNLSKTNLTIAGLEMLKKANLSLHALIARENPALVEAEDSKLVFCLDGYKDLYLDPILHQRLGAYQERQGNFSKAADLYSACNDMATSFSLAKLYLTKASDSKEFDQGFRLIEDLAEQGYKDAQYTLGRFYHKSDKAIYDYLLQHRLIANANSDNELNQLCLKKAEHWYTLAANQKDKHAALALAQLYQHQEVLCPIPAGQPRDERHQIQKALHYYRIAQEAGSTSATRNIQRLEEELRAIPAIH